MVEIFTVGGGDYLVNVFQAVAAWTGNGGYKSLLQVVMVMGLSVLVETHTEEEINRAKDAGAHIIGINNRNLDTLEIDVNTTMRLKNRVSGGYTLVSESGIHTRREVKLLEDGGVDAILVGESILTSGNIRAKIMELLGHDED